MVSLSNIDFQNDLKEILQILVTEKNFQNLIDKFILKSMKAGSSSSAAIVFFEGEKKFKFHFNHNSSIAENKLLEEEFILHSPLIKQIVNVHKKSLFSDINGSLSEFLTRLDFTSVSFSPIFNDDNLMGLLIVLFSRSKVDETELNNLETLGNLLSFAIKNLKTYEDNIALESKLAQAQKLETIGKLSSGIAHDFNNLLSSIFGSLNLLKKRVQPKDEILRLLENIETCSIRAKDLTKGLLSFGKPTPKRKEILQPKKLFNEITRVIQQTFPKDIEFTYSVDDDIEEIMGNETELYQVILNLCVNAKEAITSKGKIDFRIENINVTDENHVSYSFLESGKYVRFSVKDNGSGIKEEDLIKIFDPYFSTKHKDTGSGLGLYVSYGIVKAHNGQIDVESKEGEGTKFSVFIPALDAHVKSGKLSYKIILLADDEIMLRDLLAEMLENNNYFVVTVSNGLEALKLTEEVMVDLIIIDYNMPQMNGLECIKVLREKGIKVPIILSTGSLNFEENYDWDSLGISQILTKPYVFESMLDTIKHLGI